jgi:hypothetical protein
LNVERHRIAILAARRGDVGLRVREARVRLIDVGLRPPAAPRARLHAPQDFLVHAHVLHRDVEDALRSLHLEIGLGGAQRDDLRRVHRAMRGRFDAVELPAHLAVGGEAIEQQLAEADTRLVAVHVDPAAFAIAAADPRPGRVVVGPLVADRAAHVELRQVSAARRTQLLLDGAPREAQLPDFGMGRDRRFGGLLQRLGAGPAGREGKSAECGRGRNAR